MDRRFGSSLASAVVAISTLSLAVTALPATSAPLSGAVGTTLARPAPMTPAELGEDALDGLQYADPVENLDLIAPPEVDQQGGAGLSHPLTVPAGRADLAPDLELTYDSGAGNGWVGVGWDLSLGAVEIDTRWGAPLFCPRTDGPTCGDVESETYVLDGDVLWPTAVRSEFEPRVDERDDWRRRTETQWERIIRHGTDTTNYWWEVTDKNGTTRFYGGTPEGQRDASAILSDAEDNAVRWGLSAVRDISSNIMRISYAQPDGVAVGAADAELGTGFYVRKITYTGSLATGVKDDPAYSVDFLRDADLSPVPDRRPDVLVDASSGALETTSDLLRRIEVNYGDPVAGSGKRDHDQLVKAWDLRYIEGAFGKSLLDRVVQRGSDDKKVARHTFDYYDEVNYRTGTYAGFDTAKNWDTSGDDATNDLNQTLLGPVGLSALGASETNSGDVHAYIGFNPTMPSKLGSFGGAITVNGGGTGGLIEMMDINGDLLPDKVFRKNITGAPVQYRLNSSGPNGGTTFGPAKDVLGDEVKTLSTEASIGVAGGPEVHFGVSVQFSVAADVSIGEDYFTDVNNDGLPDFVSAGTVYFNSLNENGIPEFSSDSAGTAVPIDDGTLALPDLDAFNDFEQLQRDQSPLQDVVRRWTAPFAGTIDISGAVEFDPPSGTKYDGDGVRVAIQRGNSERWAANLATPGAMVTPSGVTGVSVAKGQAVYFRVGSIDDGVDDRVRWDPTITYTSLGTATADQNGLSQTVFHASDDFTLAGRPGTQTAMPLKGTVRLESTITKSAVTSDDVTLIVEKNGTPVGGEQVIARDFVGDVSVSKDIEVDAPSGTDADQLTVRLAADSQIDVTALEWDPRLYYLDAVDETGTAVQTEDAKTGKPIIQLAIPYDIDTYPQSTLTTPVEPWTSDLGRDVTVHAELSAVDSGGRVVLSVKKAPATPGSPATLVAKKAFTVPDTGVLTFGSTDLDVTLENGAKYWFDLTVRDPALSDATSASAVQLRWNDGADKTRDVPSTRYAAGAQGIFPIAHRGWAYAGYNADGRVDDPIDQSAFEFKQADYPTSEPTGFDDTGYQDPAQGAAFSFVPSVRDTIDPATGLVIAKTPQWRGLKDNLAGGADYASSARTASDRLGVAASAGGGGVRATRRVGVTAPVFGLVAGIGPASGSFAAGPSFGLLDYTDVNGDGFPDVVAPGSIQYTGPRGGYLPGNGDGPDVVGQDTTFAVGAGFNGSALNIKANSKGDANTAQDTATTSGTAKKPTSTGSAQQGDQASGDEYGASVGGAFGISAQFTNPGSLDADWNDGLDATSLDTDAPLERELADVNGDGLPDSVVASLDGVSVYFNLGYGFSSTPVKWSGGAFENGESYSGSVGPTLGFQWNNKEFSGGLSYNEAVDQARFSWVDVDGDGVLDRVHKVGNGTKVAFGSGSGLMPEVPYGDMADGVLELVGDIPLGEQSAQDRSRGFGGGFDFTISIGPLCLPAPLCYIIVNPGVHYERSLSSSQVQLTDVNGDGYPDSVRSTTDGEMSVRLNQRGRTNLLKTVENPIGGEIRLGYERDGNTTAQPYPLWLMTSVEVDDGRPGDGPDVQLSTFEYEGNEFDALERELMGYSTTTEHQRKFADDGNVANDPLLRSTVRTYLNNTVFDAGLLTSETRTAPDGTKLGRTEFDWTVVDAAGEQASVGNPAPGSTEALALLNQSRGVVRTGVTQKWFDSNGGLAKTQPLAFEYDALGNVVGQVDPGEPGTNADDLVSETTYSDCRSTSWVSVPATFTVKDKDGTVLRERDGSADLCLNAVPIRIEERIDDSTRALTEMTFDAWGSYNSITYPENADGDRYRVDYVYDEDRHTDVASVTDSHALTATASFSPSGRVTERTDANGNSTRYSYDPFGRLKTIRGPYEQGPGDEPSVSFSYEPDDSAYGYAVARHYDAFNPGDTIETVAFVDGIGRITQTKHDADIVDPDGDTTAPATTRMIVAGAVVYDGLGREVSESFPITEPVGTIGTYNFGDGGSPTLTEYDLLDRVTRLEEANGAVTNWAYGFGGTAGATPGDVFTTTVTDAEGKRSRTYTDLRDNVLVVDDLPEAADRIRTRYEYDPLGQLVRVVDNADNVTTHSYDDLGRRLSTDTPDGGLRTMTVDPAGNVVAEVTPNLRTAGQAISYAYDFDRLVAIDYPDGTPDVAYAYGPPGAPQNGAGRVVGIEDGARTQSLGYDPLGNVASETATMKVHNLNPQTAPKVTYTTAFTYDSFSRLDQLTYPDGEVLSHEYDSGGLLSGLQGAKTCTQLGKLAGLVDDTSTTITVVETASDAPPVPFTIRIDGEQLRVTDRVAGAVAGQWVYTVERGINGTVLEPTAAPHANGSKVVSDTPVVCEYRYLDRLEYDEFLDHRLQRTGTGVVTTWSFDLVGRLENQVTETPDRQVQNLNYTYDKVGNVLTYENAVPAGVPSLYVAPTRQEYTYDPYYRLVSATGSADVPPGKVRTFTWDVEYDKQGNVLRKAQTDQIGKANGKGKQLVQNPTTYTLNPMQYAGDGPHQLTQANARTYSWDANGNMTGWVDPAIKDSRIITWDAEDRVVEVDDSAATTEYTYDDAGRLGLERGPGGETSFVNRWYTVRNGAVPWKNIWAGDTRLAIKRSFDGDYEHQQYTLHQDLQGSTHVVTDDRARTFQHWEYFPGGEPWIREDSTVFRTPYLYGGGYLDEVRDLLNLGARWYEPREGVFLSPDPLLTSAPTAAVDDPALLPAYSYAESSPVRLVDPSGAAADAAGAQLRSGGISSSAVRLGQAAQVAAFEADLARSSRLWQSLVRFAGTDKAKSLQAFSDRFDAKPLVEVNLVKTADGWSVQNAKVSPFGFVQRKVYSGASDRAGADGTDSARAPDLGGPASGLGGPAPGAGTAAQDTGPASVAAAGSGTSAADSTPTNSGSALSGSSSLSRSSSSLSSSGSAVGSASGPPPSGAS